MGRVSTQSSATGFDRIAVQIRLGVKKAMNRRPYADFVGALTFTLEFVFLTLLVQQTEAVADTAHSEQLSIFSNIHQYCEPIVENRIAFTGWNFSVDRMPEPMGLISKFGLTSHVYSVSKTTSGASFILISYADRRAKKCEAILEFSRRPGKIRVGSPKRVSGSREFEKDFAEILEREEQICASQNPPPVKYQSLGDVKDAGDGEYILMPFSCATAVRNNSSSVDACIGSDCVRITVIGDTLFLNGAKQ